MTDFLADKVRQWQTPFAISLLPTDTFQGNRLFVFVTGDVEELNWTPMARGVKRTWVGE